MNSELFLNAAEPMSESIAIQTAIFATFILITFLIHNLFRLVSYYYPSKRYILKITSEIFSSGFAMYIVSVTCGMLCTALLFIAYLITMAFGT
jgi:hypothetical protein